MKKITLILSMLAITFVACKKDDDSSTDPGTPGGGGNTTTVPASFKQKVLLEEFTGAGQPQCTDGFVKMDNILNANTATAIPVCVHYADAMEIAQYTSLATNFGNGSGASFPSGMLNRTASLGNAMLNRTQWQSNFDVLKSTTAACGLKISSSVSGTTAAVEVRAGFNQALSGSYTVTAYLLENNVKGTGNTYDQRNGYNSTSGHTYFGAGDPIVNFNHNYVLRKVMSGAMGDAITSANVIAGGEEIKSYSVNISGYKQDDLYVVAFISKTGSSATDQPVINVQRVKLGSVQDYD